MTSLTWDDLVQCYRNTTFSKHNRGTLTIATHEILRTVLLAEADDKAASDANFYAEGTLNNPSVGDRIAVHVGAPKLSLGILAESMDALLAAPKGFVEFPERFYLIDER